jgi:hypothetical protein
LAQLAIVGKLESEGSMTARERLSARAKLAMIHAVCGRLPCTGYS